MSKTLTEQWRDGTLPEGYYYTKLNDDDGTIDINYCWDDGCFQDYCDNMVEEVLAPVHSYTVYKRLVSNSDELFGKTEQLEKELSRKTLQLEIATKALKEYANCKPTEWMTCVTADKALKEMEGVK